MKKIFFSLSVSVLSLAGCGGYKQQSTAPGEFFTQTKTFAVATTIAPDWSGGAHSVLSYTKPGTAVNNLSPTASSDLAIASYGEYFYRIERLNSDNITKFSVMAPDSPVWQFSTMDDNDGPGGEEITSSNPAALVFVNQNKAYLLRYGSQRAWIVNPSATSAEEFKTGELDLSDYSDEDGLPEMISGVVADRRLFIAMQRLNNWSVTESSYIAVFNTDTDNEINTGMGSGGLKGIKLDVRNPYKEIIYNEGYIYVAGAGDLLGSEEFGGIQRINASTYQKDTAFYTRHKIIDIDVVSGTQGYFVEYVAWGINDIKKFNAEDALVYDDAVAGFEQRNISSITTDTDGRLWIADLTTDGEGIYIIDTTTDTLEEGPVSTNLNPLDIVFCSKETVLK